MTNLIICICLCVFYLGTYFIWFDKRNVINHLNLGFCVVAYIIPSSILDFSTFASPATIDLYLYLNILGAIFFIGGLYLGHNWKKIGYVNNVVQFSFVQNTLDRPQSAMKILKISTFVYCMCAILMLLCFFYMGVAPMFAADPYAAKQFKGIYQVKYQDVALFYRTSKQFVQFLLPFLIIDFYYRKKIFIALMILFGMTLVFISLSRAEALTGFLLTLAIIFSLTKSNKFFFTYIVLIVIVYSLGSSFWVLATILFPNSGFSTVLENQSISNAIVSGAPDIIDHLTFLETFRNTHTDFSYGMTFIGGLVPFNFKWNPSVWTLRVLNETNDISDIASGGLRLPISMWGYVSFGWIGAALVPFFSAFFIGYIVKKIKRILIQVTPTFQGFITYYFVIFLYLNIGIVFTDFYRLSIYFLPAFIFYFFIKKMIRRKIKPETTKIY